MSSTDNIAQLIFAQMLALFQLGYQKECGEKSDQTSEEGRVFTRPESESYESSSTCFSVGSPSFNKSSEKVSVKCQELQSENINAKSATDFAARLFTDIQEKELHEDFISCLSNSFERVSESQSISESKISRAENDKPNIQRIIYRESIKFKQLTSENFRGSNIVNQGFGRNGSFGGRPISVN